MALLCLSVLLSACDATDTDDLFGTTVAPSVSATDPTGPEGEDSLAAIPGYQYGNMQKDEQHWGNYLRFGDTVLIEYHSLNNLNLEFYDFVYDMKTGQVSLLCQESACDHIWGVEDPEDPETYKPCVSRVLARLEQYDGRIFGVSNDVGRLSELKDGGFENIVERGVKYYCHGSNGELYVRTLYDELVVYEPGSDTPRMLLKDYTGIWNVVFGDYLYGSTETGVVRVDLRAEEPQAETVLKLKYPYTAMTDGRHIYYRDVDGRNQALFRCDMDGSNPTVIFDKPAAARSLNFDDEYLYFTLDTDYSITAEEKHDVYRMSKDDPSKVEHIATLPEYAYQIFTVPGFDKIFVTTLYFDEDREPKLGGGPVYAVNIDGSGAEKLVLPEF